MAAIASAVRQRRNELTAGYFALAMLGLIAVFTFIHWVDIALQRRSLKDDGPIAQKIVCAGRRTRGVLLRKIPGFTTIGHAVTFIIYIAINLILSFYALDWSVLNNFAKRLGWIAACNVALITFLALKNTPLAFLTAYSYERLNILHQAAGYSTVVWSLCHAVVYITAWSYSKSLTELLELANIMGIVAGIAMAIILVSSLLLRKLRYEVFYIIHIVMFMLILIAVGMHRPIISKKVPAMIITAAGIWLSDRAIRGGRMIWYAYGNSATITPLSHGGARISIKRAPKGAVPGSHCFLWIPGIRALETHPFTIATISPLELVVKAHDGFTADLLALAQSNPGAVMRASIDGPYGTVPDLTKFNEAIFIAGGSGGSFTFGVVLNFLRQLGLEDKKPNIKFIWVIREYEQTAWYRSELDEISNWPNISISIFLTRSPFIPGNSIVPLASQEATTEIAATIPSDLEKCVFVSPTVERSNEVYKEESVYVATSLAPSPQSAYPTIQHVRPLIPDLLRSDVKAAAPHSRILVAACGPTGMMLDVRKTVVGLLGGSKAKGVSVEKDNIGRDDVSIELCIEAFGW